MRVATAVALLLLSVWSLLLPVSVPISSTAAVTARVAAVSTPIAGDLVALAGDTGDPIGLGSLLAEVQNPGARDDAQLDQAERRVVEAQDEEAALARELTALEAERDRCAAQVEDDRKRLVRDAEHRLAESERTFESLEAARDLKRAALDQLAARRDRSALEVVGEADVEAARREVAVAEKLALVESERTARLRGHVEDARAGSFIALGVEPADLRRLEELRRRLERLRPDQAQASARTARARSELEEGQRRMRAAAQRRIVSPVRGLVWQRTGNVGQYVEAGKELYRIADIRTVQVQAYFHRRYLDGVAIGHRASVYLVSAGRVVHGTVKHIQSIEAARVREEFALDLPSPDEDQFKVVLELDEEGRKLAEIGGVAKVAVLGKLDGRLQRALLWLYLRFES